MLSVNEALAKIVASVAPLPAEEVRLGEALGRVLAGEITSSIDSPPFDKSLMDGFAVRSADVVEGRAALDVVETVTAGNLPTRRVEPGTATRIMTGAPLPEGADAVVPVEVTAFDEATGRVTIASRLVAAGANVIRRGTNTRVGELVLSPGRVLRPQELGTLAELGCATVPVYRRPRVAVLATGDELVPVEETPGPGRIRNSNETLLVAQLRRMGADPVPLGIARDDRAHLRERIEWGLACDFLLLSGGVSAGTLDLVPSELAAAGVVEVFHGVNVKPGKPVWFGLRPHNTAPTCVFGLPGNPVSSMVCAELFARTAIRRATGVEPAIPPTTPGRLAHDHTTRGDRPVYHPACLEWTEDGTRVHLVAWHGSSDLRATVEANGLALIPAGDATHPAGAVVQTIPLV
jgi:molybdopterin molybdotransferase